MTDPLSRPATSAPEHAIQGLNALLAWYSSQEVAYYKKLWGNEDERDQGAWCESTEREWSRYRNEAAAIRAGIIALGGTPDDSAYSGTASEKQE